MKKRGEETTEGARVVKLHNLVVIPIDLCSGDSLHRAKDTMKIFIILSSSMRLNKGVLEEVILLGVVKKVNRHP